MASAIDSATLLQSALDLIPGPALIAEASGTIVLVNGELERQFGYAREELIGQLLELLVPGGLWSRGDEMVSLPDRSTEENHREFIVRRKDGSCVTLQLRLQSIRVRDKTFVLATLSGPAARCRQDDHPTALRDELEFGRVVADLSVQFVNMSDDRLAEAIQDALRRIGVQFGLDGTALYRLDRDGTPIDPITWTAADAVPASSSLFSDLFPWTVEQIGAGQVVVLSRIDDLPSETDRVSFRAQGTKSVVVVPLSVEERIVGAIAFQMVRAERTWPADVVSRLMVIGGMFSQLFAKGQRDQAIRAASLELQRLRDELQLENTYLRQEERAGLGPPHVIGRSPALQHVLQQIHQVATTDATVLLRGETGTGKELFAAYIHELSARHARPMVRVNCAAIPATLIESELFGRERGAFTGSLARQVGRFELANHSTIFLDEVGDLPADVQVKLLRVLEERTIERLGNPRPIGVDTRIIAATHRDLEQLTADGAFREDLYYRLNVFPIHVPPLRERVEDIPLLFLRFVEEFSRAFGKRVDPVDNGVMASLQHYSWPGNIRELRNVVERTMIVTTSRRLTINLPVATAPAQSAPRLVDVEKEHIRAVLESTGWRIRGRGGAAEQLGLKPTTLETRIAKLGLKRPRHH